MTNRKKTPEKVCVGMSDNKPTYAPKIEPQTPEEQSQEIMKSTMPDSWDKYLELVSGDITGNNNDEKEYYMIPAEKLNSLLKQERQRVVGEIRKVWEDAGVNPEYHNLMKNQLKTKWPLLYKVITNLIQKLNEKE